MSLDFYIIFVYLLAHNSLLNCASVAVQHSHSIISAERESDGSYKSRDHDHYSDGVHHTEFDHEAILGSVREAEEFDKLSPAESKQRLGQLLPKMDLNSNGYIDRNELKQWILVNFMKLSLEEAEERMGEADENRDGAVSWQEYLLDAFGVDREEDVGQEDTGYTDSLLIDEKKMWEVADKNGDGMLDHTEFEMFSNPEQHEAMHPLLVQQTVRNKDTNGDGLIDFQEYLGDKANTQDQSFMIAEKDKFENELDLDKNGVLDNREIHAWVIPSNEEIALEEVDHLFASADDDNDDKLSFDEILRHYDVFVGSEATDYGNDLMHGHFDDEL